MSGLQVAVAAAKSVVALTIPYVELGCNQVFAKTVCLFVGCFFLVSSISHILEINRNRYWNCWVGDAFWTLNLVQLPFFNPSPFLSAHFFLLILLLMCVCVFVRLLAAGIVPPVEGTESESTDCNVRPAMPWWGHPSSFLGHVPPIFLFFHPSEIIQILKLEKR